MELELMGLKVMRAKRGGGRGISSQLHHTKRTRPPVEAAVRRRHIDPRNLRVAPLLLLAPGLRPLPVKAARRNQHLVVRPHGRVAVAQDLDHAQPANRPAQRVVGKGCRPLERGVGVLGQRAGCFGRGPEGKGVDVSAEGPFRGDVLDWAAQRFRGHLDGLCKG